MKHRTIDKFIESLQLMLLTAWLLSVTVPTPVGRTKGTSVMMTRDELLMILEKQPWFSEWMDEQFDARIIEMVVDGQPEPKTELAARESIEPSATTTTVVAAPRPAARRLTRRSEGSTGRPSTDSQLTKEQRSDINAWLIEHGQTTTGSGKRYPTSFVNQAAIADYYSALDNG